MQNIKVRINVNILNRKKDGLPQAENFLHFAMETVN